MINSVQNVKIQTKDPLTDYRKNGNHFIAPEIANDIYELGEKNKEKRGRKIGLIIASGAVAATLTVLAFTRGIPKNTYKWLDKLSKQIGKHINQRKIHGNNGHITELFNKIHYKVSRFGEKAKSINNVTTFKDLLFMKLMYKNKHTTKVHKNITKWFEGLARRTVNHCYEGAENRFATLFDLFNKSGKSATIDTQITVNGVTKSTAEWLKELVEKQKYLQEKLNNCFGKQARQGRYASMSHATKNLDKDVWQIGVNGIGEKGLSGRMQHMKNAKLHSSFIAEELLAKHKAGLVSKTNLMRDSVIIDTNEILEIYKAILPKKEYAILLRKANLAINDLKKAVNTENNEFFDKLRDLKLGSGPTDVLSIIGTTGAVGAGLAMADNKDERISALLKYGIPAIGGIATSLIMTVSLISGFTAMFAGLVIGEAMNIAGSKVDKMIKHHNKLEQDKELNARLKSQNA